MGAPRSVQCGVWAVAEASSRGSERAQRTGWDSGWARRANERGGRGELRTEAAELTRWARRAAGEAAQPSAWGTAAEVSSPIRCFLSIDCGLDAKFRGRKDTYTDIDYVSDSPYVDGGENHKVAAEFDTSATPEDRRTLRSFPSGLRNCYTLPTESGAKYLVRMVFFYGDYDGKTSPSFEVHLGSNYWDTFDGSSYWWSEAVFIAWASWVPVCLVNTGSGTPFVNTVELRPLEATLYPQVTADESISAFARKNLGTNDTLIRFPDDPYDRFWEWDPNSSWTNLSTKEPILQDGSFPVPIPVLETAVAPVNNGTVLNVNTWKTYKRSFEFTFFLHFSDIQNTQLRLFDLYVNDEQLMDKYSPSYLAAGYVYSSTWSKTTDGKYNITLAASPTSVLPPMINAYEVYNNIPHDTPRTSTKDCEMPPLLPICFPTPLIYCHCRHVWDLSNSNLTGLVSDNFTFLTDLQFLYESGEDMCNKTISPPPSRNRTAIVSISVVVPMVAVSVLVLSYLIWRVKRKPKICTHDPPKESELQSAPGSTRSHGDHLQNTENHRFTSTRSQGDHLQNTENRRFTYMELQKFTNKFERFIGQGGFGLVYYGRLEDNSEVAVKMRSESSSHGLDEFLAEVHSLTKVHHRNLVSLVGYCWEKDHLALVYEYMSRGNLCDHLRGKHGDETLDWATRVRVVLEAAQGLDYPHKGCSLPIIHRDVKTSNILLGQNLRAKIADFGLCKTYLSETQTHISTNAAGSAGYFDPEYYHTGRLTESSDVYSFGVVLLEIATGEPLILPGHGHIVQRMKQKMATGNITSVADARLGGAYEVTSMWKLVDTAIACTADAAVGRPTMAAVVAQLKESIALEEARVDSAVRVSPVSDTVALVSTFSPSAR
ncbi:probable LRR receptor-like serine/threonine-protein kinase At1g51810 [Triticum aestivum]|uniref:probable LRR receptor-like serine/threonine-protein kinase At1g51810 n=1 Tax=Triticum aestivum TaxID=4565 RepID=UPI001D0318D7|nr:probable LRR receptor-like serine/threonine-protein kinase At1g51810 [Triticum aestivum]